MAKEELLYIFFTCFVVTIKAETDDLPLCPTNIQFLPQDLPMHCRMPRSVNEDPAAPPVAMPLPPPFYQNPPSDKQPNPIPIPVPPGGPAPFSFPGMPPPGGPFPVPMPMGMMPMPPPAHKLPVIVMPFYSPDPAFKKSQKTKGNKQNKRPRRPRRPRWPQRPRHRFSDTDTDTDDTDSDCDDASSDTSTDTSSDTSSDGGWWNRGKGKKGGKRNARRSNKNQAHKSTKNHKMKKDLLTPVLQYVTKDGYVIFEKQISKNEAKEWLQVKKDTDVEDASKETKTNIDEVVSKIENSDREEMNHDYRTMSREREKVTEIVTTEKAHKHKKHHQHKPNILLDSNLTEKRSSSR